jgi:uncharacterized protein (TIGR02145 family)
MKILIIVSSIIIHCFIYGQKSQNIDTNTGLTTNPTHEIDSIRFNPNTGQMEVILLGGGVESVSLQAIDSISFSGNTPVYAHGSIFCGNTTEVIEVVSLTGRVWMDRNLGATKVADSITDPNAYGSYFQWGRGTDGHQCNNSGTTTVLSSSDQPGHGDFITVPLSGPSYDWRSPGNSNLWQGVNGINNPCPCGFRLPTTQEFQAEVATWNSATANGGFESVLKLPVAGRAPYESGDPSEFPFISGIDTHGYYWTSNTDDTRGGSIRLNNGSMTFLVGYAGRATGYTVRCIKD